MELDRRVNDLEIELKIVKGEVKELLVDIRDLMNRTENPFCSIQNQGAPGIKAVKKEASAGKDTAEKETEKPDTPPENVPERISPKPEMPPCEPPLSFRNGIDTFMLVELMRWVDYSVRTIGHDNLNELLKLYTITGQLSDNVRDVIQNIAELSTEEPAEEKKVSMKDNITVLSQLSAILNPGESRKRIQQLYEDDAGWNGEEKEMKKGITFS
ncbi:hypothetical protein FTO70_14995 [Methanosarcina sp. KYL-1]|uniref:FlaD/FlaE family flagellar protein n=1 Tax=Methanosarcina sp. KYL-1 TaxID=2602068 RepID=UPI002100EA81|nr:FlaD/FlaE family flagellar protein [Methanosarcina sp. KYL-1]MCQ1536955.1 hypothetical protein [Methanosarcina sp. KYL-1]